MARPKKKSGRRRPKIARLPPTGDEAVCAPIPPLADEDAAHHDGVAQVHEHEPIEVHEPQPGASPGTLLIGEGEPPRVFVIDYGPGVLFEKELSHVDEVIQYLEDEHPSITWI